MKTFLTATATILALATPALAEGDAEAGKKAFNKCKACHMLKSEDGEDIVKGGRTGPNLYGIIGRTAGSVEDFKYGKDLVAAGEAGLVWDETNLAEYSADPRAFLRTTLGDDKAKSKMTFKLKKGGEDVAAFLAQYPAAGSEEASDGS